jgi:hypothetical protein
MCEACGVEDERPVEADEQELTVKLPADWDADDVAALLRRAADELDAVGETRIDSIGLTWTERDEEQIPVISLAYRRYKRPPDVPDYAAPADIPDRDDEGRIVGFHSRPSGTIISNPDLPQ